MGKTVKAEHVVWTLGDQLISGLYMKIKYRTVPIPVIVSIDPRSKSLRIDMVDFIKKEDKQDSQIDFIETHRVPKEFSEMVSYVLDAQDELDEYLSVAEKILKGSDNSINSLNEMLKSLSKPQT